MLVICLPFKDWKNNARLPKYLKRISYSMWNIYLVEIRNFNRKFEKKIAESKKLNKNKAKLNTTPRYLNLCIWTSQANGLSKFSCSFLFQSSSFLDSYLQNGLNFIQCICDGKHTRTEVMNLKRSEWLFCTLLV